MVVSEKGEKRFVRSIRPYKIRHTRGGQQGQEEQLLAALSFLFATAAIAHCHCYHSLFFNARIGREWFVVVLLFLQAS